MTPERACIAIDLKSFYASVECVERGLDPLDTNLVVADTTRTEKTICLAVTPPLKAQGVPGRPRLFEVVQKVHELNAARMRQAPYGLFRGSSTSAAALAADPSLEVDYITAMPRMALYIEYSTRVYQVYLRHIAPEDICVYSIDEVFLDATRYLATCRVSARELTMRILREVLEETGITATAGIGTNLYLAKVAMDIVAKHSEPDENGARIAELDEMSYRRKLWTHRPITDFWRVGAGYARKLAENGMTTMGDVARCSLRNQNLLYHLFGINAELLIDHAWGWEPTEMQDIHAYRPENRSVSSGQVLMAPYPFEKTCVIVREMAQELALDLLAKRLVTDQIVLTIGYDVENLRGVNASQYQGPVHMDRYGRARPAHAHGTKTLDRFTSSASILTTAFMELFERIVDRNFTARRVTLVAGHVIGEQDAARRRSCTQLSLLTDHEREREEEAREKERLAKERKCQDAVLNIRKKFGKNAILKGTNFEDGATAKSRHEQIGGHRA